MVKAKHLKNKPKKQPQIKKHGNQVVTSEFHSQLDALGLKIMQVTADGNCFFRALADQLEGDEDEHEKYRTMVVQFILRSREMFEPFIEDDLPFDEYCQSMGKDGTWAGNMELQAASLVTHSNICIHRHSSPRWYIQNFDNRGARMIHLSYHDGEHYNSIRLKEDMCDGPAKPIIIKVDANLSATSDQSKDADTKSKGESVKNNKNTILAGSIKMVMAGSGCENTAKVGQVLLLVGGDVDAAIEFLIAEHGAEEDVAEKDGNNEMENSERPCEELKENGKHDLSGNGKERVCNGNGSQLDEKQKISRNKACPCGSKKKYKACCGAVTGGSTPRFSVQTVDYGKNRKEKKQGKKAGFSANSHGLDGGPPDVGALCI